MINLPLSYLPFCSPFSRDAPPPPHPPLSLARACANVNLPVLSFPTERVSRNPHGGAAGAGAEAGALLG